MLICRADTGDSQELNLSDGGGFRVGVSQIDIINKYTWKIFRSMKFPGKYPRAGFAKDREGVRFVLVVG